MYKRQYFLSLLALSCEKAGFADEAFDALVRALEHADSTDERWFEAELHRQKGEWLIVHRERREEAEACFHRAIAVAQKQHAKLWELRAATSLAALWQDQRPQDARKMLAPVYDWFGKGPDTPDLKRAKALLGELAE